MVTRHRIISALLIPGAFSLACSSRGEGKSSATSEDPSGSIAGSWKLGGEREYVFGADGTFSMIIDTGRCSDAGATKQTASGNWKIDGHLVVLDVAEASEAILRGATLRESILERSESRMVVESSVAGCSGQRVELHRAP